MHYYRNNREVWYKLIVRGMTGDYSWYSSATKYMDMYERLAKPATDFTLTEEAPAEVPAEVTENPKEAPAVEAAPAPEAPAPKKRGPRKKKAEEESVTAEAPAEPAPKKRAPRKKKAEEAPAE